MNTPINENYEEYKDDVWKGLSGRELKWGGIAVASGIAAMLFLLLYLKWNATLSTFVMMPFTCLIGVNGFYNKNGMSFMEYLKRKKTVIFGKTLVIRERDIREYRIKKLEQEIQENRVDKSKKGKRNGKV